MKLNNDVVKKLVVTRKFEENKERITSLDFSFDGLNLVASADDDSINVYDCTKGTKKCPEIFCKKYGIDLIRFTHNPDTVIHNSTKLDDSIRYLSLLDNKYFRYFSGHTKKVNQLCMSPVNETFLSGSLDNTVRLWDINSMPARQAQLAYINTFGAPLINFDPEGIVFSVGTNSDLINMYDVRMCKKPYKFFKMSDLGRNCEWTSLSFSPDGYKIMITTNDGCIYLIDSFNGALLQQLSITNSNHQRIPFEASFSPDSAYIYSGSSDGYVCVFCATTERLVAKLFCQNNFNAVQCVRFNPKFLVLSTASSILVSCFNANFYSLQNFRAQILLFFSLYGHLKLIEIECKFYSMFFIICHCVWQIVLFFGLLPSFEMKF